MGPDGRGAQSHEGSLQGMYIGLVYKVLKGLGRSYMRDGRKFRLSKHVKRRSEVLETIRLVCKTDGPLQMARSAF